jgi:hypothetical protein
MRTTEAVRPARTWLRTAAAAAGCAALSTVAAAAVAAPSGEGDVDVTVQIAPLEEPGVLALTVAGTQAVLTENGSDALIRQFTGALPEVTVADTRAPGEVPSGTGWYVLGSVSDFTGDAGQPTIGAGHLGWTPRLVTGGESGLVAEGDPVGTVLDQGPDAVGLVDQELLAIAADSAAVAPEGRWTATADLVLRTPADVAPGGYAATLTLSLFE